MDRVLASRSFQSSDTLSRFLRYAVEQALEGRTDRLKEYSLGVDVLGRSPSFDPRIDSIVRVEASRLRARLAEYYRTEGRDDTVRIELPKGSYAPRFHAAAPSPHGEVQGSSARKARVRRPWLAAAVIVALASLGAAGWMAVTSMRGLHPRDPKTPAASIAVLPFVYLGSDKDVDYLGEGITEEITNALARLPGLRVTARSSAFRFKGGTDVREVGRQLDVSTVLEGSVRKSGNRLRITAQLVSAVDGYHLWSDTYDRDPSEILTIQASIAKAIAGNLNLKLAAGSGADGLRRHTKSADAYNQVLKARHLNAITEDTDATMACYRRALEYDPDYAEAYVGMADEWVRQAVKGTVPPRQVMEKARNAAGNALRLDDSLPGAHYLSAMIKWIYDWDWSGADREFARALQLNPNSAPTRVQYARYLALMGRRQEALSQLDQIRALDPISAGVSSIEAAVYYMTGDHDRTIQHAQAVLAGEPNVWLLYYWMGRAYDSKGRLPEAIGALEKWHNIPGSMQGRGFGMLGSVYARAGRRADALRLLESAIDRSKRAHVAPSSIALIYIGVGDPDRAMEWLGKAYDERDHSLVGLKADPAYDPLRAHPKFVGLLQRMNLQ